MVAREALTLKGAWCVGADAVVAHVPSLALVHICRAQGYQRVRMQGSRASAALFALLLMAWSTSAEARRPHEKHGTLTPLLCGTPCPGDLARCCQGPWPGLIPKSLGLPLLHSPSPSKRHLPHPLFPYSLGLPCPRCMLLLVPFPHLPHLPSFPCK